MTRREAYDILNGYIWSVGGTGVEYWTDSDRDKMLACLRRLYNYDEENIIKEYHKYDSWNGMGR